MGGGLSGRPKEGGSAVCNLHQGTQQCLLCSTSTTPSRVAACFRLLLPLVAGQDSGRAMGVLAAPLPCTPTGMHVANTRHCCSPPRGSCALVVQVIAESQPPSGNDVRPFYDFLESCLRHKSEVVIFEAARAICNMRDVTTRELTPAVTVLQLFLSSSKPVLRFAAVRTLNKVRRAAA